MCNPCKENPMFNQSFRIIKGLKSPGKNHSALQTFSINFLSDWVILLKTPESIPVSTIDSNTFHWLSVTAFSATALRLAIACCGLSPRSLKYSNLANSKLVVFGTLLYHHSTVSCLKNSVYAHSSSPANFLDRLETKSLSISGHAHNCLPSMV